MRSQKILTWKQLKEEGKLDNNLDTYICKSLTLTTFPKVPSPRVASTLSAIEKKKWDFKLVYAEHELSTHSAAEAFSHRPFPRFGRKKKYK